MNNPQALDDYCKNNKIKLSFSRLFLPLAFSTSHAYHYTITSSFSGSNGISGNVYAPLELFSSRLEQEEEAFLVDAIDATYLKKAADEALKLRGHANVIIAGAPGIGKSTLINAVFHGNLALTGDGHPVTTGVRAITKEGIPITIVDTRGLTRSNFQEDLKELEAFLQLRQSSSNPLERIHIAWVCILEDTRRVEDADDQLVKLLTRYKIPVVVVITKSISDSGFKDTVQQLLPEARNVVRVHALPTVLDEGYTIPIMGLKTLVDQTMNILPESVRNAFAAAQKANLDMKRQRSHLAVATSAALAAGIGSAPIPFSDATALIPTQIGMFATISAIWGVPVSYAFLGTLLSSTITSTLGTLGGRILVARILKLLPGVGPVTSRVITGGIAGTITTTFGEAYIAALYSLTQDNPNRELSPDELRKAFEHHLK